MKRTGQQLLRDYALYFAIITAILGATFWLMVTGGPDSDSSLRFLGCTLSGTITFTLLIRTSKLLWQRRLFWVVVALLLVFHCGFFWFVRLPNHISGFGVILFLAMELGFFNTVRVICFRYHPPEGEEIV